ncbi:MAG: hypothetical protein JST38_20660 [Bacteroidetes bacterium]|nr:hypothetical protein [Bacteroidota bacterium]MBS1943281.1 hypothetical protein [Bacteroidota bacterium]
MRYHSHKLPFVVLLATALLSAACNKERPEPQWDVNLVVPLVKTKLTIGNLIPDSILSTDQAGNVSILYSASLFTLSLDTVLTAPDTSFRYAYAIPFPGPVQFQPGATFNTSDDVTHFNLDGLDLTELQVRTGQVDVAISNMMNGNIVGLFSLPGATLNGAPFSISQNLPPGTPQAPSFTNNSRPLDGYVFDMRGPDHNAVNTLATHLSYANSADGNAISITNMDSLIAVVSYHDIIPQYATGSFGTRTISIDPSSSALDLFENISGMLDLDQVSAVIRIHNGIGVDARATIHYLRSVNTTTGTSVDLNHAITTGPVNIDRALDLGNGFQPALNTFQLNQGNSNIDLFMENLPNRVDYALDVQINPLGDISNGHDFLYHDSKLSADLDVDIPLRLIATNLTLRKTIELDLPGTAGSHAWKSGTLHLFAENEFPFSATVEVAVVDDAGQVLTVLAPGGTVASAQLGPDGLVASGTSSRLDLGIDPGQMNLLQQTGKVRITAVFNTADQGQHVQLLDRYALALQLTVDADYTVNGDE